MAALTRTAARLLCQNRTNVLAALTKNPVRAYSSLQESDGDTVVNNEISAMMKDRKLRQETVQRTSVEAFMQARMGVKRELSDEELQLIGGDPDILEADSDMMEEWIDTVRGDMDTYDQATVEINAESAKIIGSGAYNDPVLVPTQEDERQIICFCEQMDGDSVFLNLALGERRPCQCGNWFQLVKF